jgi:hypothetical protein
MSPEDYRTKFKEGDSPGWWAIDAALEALYPEQEPKHWAPPLPAMLGGSDPIDGVSLYNSTATGRAHTHLVSYGMSDLHFMENYAPQEFSGMGFEFTSRIAPFPDDPNGPMWMIQMMNNLTRYLIQSGRWFEPGHFLNAKGPIRLNTRTSLTAVAFVMDPELGVIDTPHGKVEFLQIVGLTTSQYEKLEAAPSTDATLAMIDEMRVTNPLLIIDLAANPG